MTDEQLFDFCQTHQDLRVERTADGELIIMAPTGGETSDRNAALTAMLKSWSWIDGTGVAFDSSIGFYLPNGAMRSPDAAWVRRERLSDLTKQQRKKFLPLCPDFVVELLSPTDSLKAIQEKMQEYIDNGERLGWLIDAENRRVYAYRPNSTVEILDDLTIISGDPELPGFVLDLNRIWNTDFEI